MDVRQVATSHVQAVKVAKAANQRYILVARSVWWSEIGTIIKNNYNKYGYKATDYEV